MSDSIAFTEAQRRVLAHVLDDIIPPAPTAACRPRASSARPTISISRWARCRS
jgi:hypothetical protein